MHGNQASKGSFISFFFFKKKGVSYLFIEVIKLVYCIRFNPFVLNLLYHALEVSLVWKSIKKNSYMIIYDEEI